MLKGNDIYFNGSQRVERQCLKSNPSLKTNLKLEVKSICTEIVAKFLIRVYTILLYCWCHTPLCIHMTRTTALKRIIYYVRVGLIYDI